MVEEKDLKDGEILWISELEFNNKTGRFGCLRNLIPTKGVVRKEPTGYRLIDLKNNISTLCYICTDATSYSSYRKERVLNTLYKTEEEAVDEYNRQIYIQMDKLDSFYEEQKRKLNKKLIKKKED